MYSRRSKSIKKKVKTGQGGSASSVWGPRIALEEQAAKVSIGKSISTNEIPRPPSVFRNPYANPNPIVIYQSKSSKIVQKMNSSEGLKESKEMKKPLTVIIPNQKVVSEKYDYAYDNSEDNNGRRRSRYGQGHNYDSLPSTETWQSSTDDESEPEQNDDNDNDDNNEKRECNDENIKHNNNQRWVQETRNILKDSETIEVPVPICKIKPTKLKISTCEQAELDLDSESSVSSSTLDSSHRSTLYKTEFSATGGTTTAFGITMVYVPMEQGESKSKLLLDNKNNENFQEPITTLAHFQSLETSVEKKSSLVNGVATRSSASASASASGIETDGKDPDGDSLLESFDSILFKPTSKILTNGGNASASASASASSSPGTSSGVESSFSQNHLKNDQHMGRHVDIVYKPGYAPPLPPNNKPKQIFNNVSKKNLRFSDYLDVKPKSPSPKIILLPEIFNNQSKNNRRSIDTNDICQCTSSSSNFITTTAILSCGHEVTHDNYSTISSIDSFQCASANGQTPITTHHNNMFEKSALQQLRDLSILIGGSFHTPSIIEEVRGKSHRDKKLSKSETFSPPPDGAKKFRKISTTTATSGDSGKGSGSGQTPDTNNNRSNHNSPIELPDDSCIFRPDCQECLNLSLYRNPYEQQEPENYNNPNRHHPTIHAEILTTAVLNRKTKILRRRTKFTTKNSKTKPKLNKKIPNSIEDHNNHNNNQPTYNHGIYTGGSINCVCNCKCLSQSLNIGSGTNKNIRKSGLGVVDNNSFNSQLLGGKTVVRSEEFSKSSPGGISSSSSGAMSLSIEANLFTIDEEDERVNDNNSGIRLEVRKNHNDNNGKIHGHNFPEDELEKNNRAHIHPNCWLATDATMGWSDLESLYSQNLKFEKPIEIPGECLTCWKELTESKKRNLTNNTIDRTKRMFIWLNKRPKEFAAPWWEAKKQASLKWVVAKAFKNIAKDSPQLSPFRESKKDKTKLELKDELIRDLTNGKLYTLVLNNLFHSTDPPLHRQLTSNLQNGQKLTLWDIIKILSRKGVYVAQPSDMKLTEGTLQRKPLRIAAHIALVEALIGLYAKELLSRERVITILNSFGHTLNPDAQHPEQLVISWINSVITTLKAYILSIHRINKTNTPTHQLQRWLNVNLVTEIRDLSDGVGISALFVLYFSNDIRLNEISVPEPGEMLNIYETSMNHSMIQKLCDEIFPEKIYHLAVSDFLYVHGYMKQNILAFLIDLFIHLEVNPIIRVNRLTHVPLRLQL